MIVGGEDVATFLGQGDDTALVALAREHLRAMSALARGWTRGAGFASTAPGGYAECADDLAAVIVAATARLVSNPAQFKREEVDGYAVTGGFDGFTLAEQMILNRYRRRAA